MLHSRIHDHGPNRLDAVYIPISRPRLTVRVAFISDTHPGTSTIDKIYDPLKIELCCTLEEKIRETASDKPL